MKHTTLKLAGMALAIAASALTGRADVALNENVSLYGYAAGYLEYNQLASGDNSSTGMDLRAAKVGTAFNFAPVTAKLSTYYVDGDFYLLEANATYDFGQGLSLMGGRFLSKFSYEPFDIPAAFFITSGNDAFGAIFDLVGLPTGFMPNFHEGVRLEYVINKENTAGISFVDSLYNRVDYYGNGNYALSPYHGDGKLNDGYGIEAYYRYNNDALSIGATLGYQNSRKNSNAHLVTNLANTYAADVWAQYVINKNTLLAAELFYRVDSDKDYYGPNSKLKNISLYYGLVTVKQQLNDKFSLAGRYTYGNTSWDHKDFPLYDTKGGKIDSMNFMKFSVTPAYAVTKNLSVAAELNYTKYDYKFLGKKGDKDSKVYLGVQACFSF